MAGSGALGFGSGFAKGIANALITRQQQEREDQRHKEDQDFRTFLMLEPVARQQMLETGDAGSYQSVLEKLNPELAKLLVKEGQSPFEHLMPILGGQAAAPEGQSAEAPPSANLPQVPPSDPGAQAPVPSEPSTRWSFGGTPLLSAEERAAKTEGADLEKLKREIAARQSIGERAGLQGEELRRFTLTGQVSAPQDDYAPLPQGAGVYSRKGGNIVEPPSAKTVAAPQIGTFGDYLVRRQTEAGHPLTAADVATARKDWEQISSTSQSVNAGSFEDYTLRYAKELGKDPASLTPTDIETARKKYADAGRETKEGGDDVSAIAAMAAQNPAVLQGLTPTVTGAVLGAIAKDPKLRSQYEQTRMEPIRAQAQTALSTLDDLLDVDPKTGKVLGLKSGAKSLYGKGLDRMSRYIPGSEAATAKAALDQVTGQLVLDIIGQMKAQSRTGSTGFGQLNIRELGVIESAATVLKGEISEAKALQELTKLRERFAKVLQPAAAERTPAAGKGSPITLDTPVFIGPDGRPQIGTP